MSCMSKFNNVSNYNMNTKFDSSFPNLPCFECPSYLHILSYLMVGFSSILVSLIMCSYKRGWVHAHFISQTMSCFHLPLVVGHSSSLPNRSHWLFEHGPILINPPSPWTGPVLVGLPRHGIGHVLTIYSRPWTGPIFNIVCQSLLIFRQSFLFLSSFLLVWWRLLVPLQYILYILQFARISWFIVKVWYNATYMWCIFASQIVL